MSDSLVQLSQDARGVARITLCDAQRFNALSSEMLAALQSALDAVGRDEQARVVVLAAEGRAFCAGHNLKDMATHTELDYYRQLFAQCSRMMLSIQKLPVPVIARVQGIATAAGCQLVAQCDLAVASSEARFATSGIQYGLFCATPSVPLVRNMPLKQSMQMLLTGEFIDAETALHYGLLNRVAEPERLDAAVEELVAAIVSKPRMAIRMGKELVYRQREMGLESAYELAGQTMAINMLDADAQEGAQAFAQKRKPGWS
ncbi:MAG: enoyl-CoA hydratase [Comamonas sp.]|jgi:enoyl-CoA hydratase/carnithine racemase|uniref:enoyl-CoA hydratase n=1 Tax=Comamonas sp. TaxID=34028 RepID=UPI0025E2E7FB|nr:enoyl-CoA hydratase [Comamonas sp.]MDR3064157.1 enoyl-CoA hydratase [Comamonas sp.]